MHTEIQNIATAKHDFILISVFKKIQIHKQYRTCPNLFHLVISQEIKLKFWKWGYKRLYKIMKGEPSCSVSQVGQALTIQRLC